MFTAITEIMYCTVPPKIGKRYVETDTVALVAAREGVQASLHPPQDYDCPSAAQQRHGESMKKTYLKEANEGEDIKADSKTAVTNVMKDLRIEKLVISAYSVLFSV